MKTWIAQAPKDEDFNRFETENGKTNTAIYKAFADFKDDPVDFNSLKTFTSAIKTDAIAPISSDMIIEGVNFTDKIKGSSFINTGTTTAYTLSATTENLRRVTVKDEGVKFYSDYTLRPDDFAIYFDTGSSYFIPSYYDGFNIMIHAANNGRGGVSKYDVAIQNLTLSTTLNVSIDASGFPDFYGQKTYYNVGAGIIALTFTNVTSSDFLRVYVRRCAYPIVADQPIKVLNSLYSDFEQRQITEADFTSFKIS